MDAKDTEQADESEQHVEMTTDAISSTLDSSSTSESAVTSEGEEDKEVSSTPAMDMPPLEQKADNGEVVEVDPPAHYSVDLLRSFPEVCQKAKSGVQTCHVVAVFIQEYANMETTYSKALLKAAQ